MEPDLSKLSDAVIEAVEAQTFACPHCSEEICLHHIAVIPKKQIFTLKLESDTGSFSASTLGGTITNLDKLMKAVAKDAGGRVEMFVESLKRSEKSLEIGFLVTSVVQPKNGKT